MKRLLAKLPRSSSGSRAASASSSASRWPFAIFDVSMTAATVLSGFALVSSAICFSGASSGDFTVVICHSERSRGISQYSLRKVRDVSTSLDMTTMKVRARISFLIKFRFIPGVLLQYLAWRKFLLALRQAFEFIDDFVQSEMFGETQRPASERRETGSQNHSVVRVLRRIDHFLLYTTSGLVNHQEDEPVRQLLFVQPQPRIAMPVRRNIRSLCAFGLAVQRAPPLCERLVRHLRFTLIFVKTGGRFAAQHLTVAQPEQHGRNVIAPSVRLFQCIANIDRDIDANFVDQPQRSHRHAPLQKCIIDLVRVQAALEKLGGVEQIRKQHAVDQKTWVVANDHRQFPNLPCKSDRALARVVRCLFCNDHFHQFHSTHWIEKMQTDDVLGRNGCIGELANWKSRRIRGNDRFRTGLHRQLEKDFLFD